MDSGDGLHPGHMWAWEEEDCPDVGHIVPSGVRPIPILTGWLTHMALGRRIPMVGGWAILPTARCTLMDILQGIRTHRVHGEVLMDRP